MKQGFACSSRGCSLCAAYACTTTLTFSMILSCRFLSWGLPPAVGEEGGSGEAIRLATLARLPSRGRTISIARVFTLQAGGDSTFYPLGWTSLSCCIRYQRSYF